MTIKVNLTIINTNLILHKNKQVLLGPERREVLINGGEGAGVEKFITSNKRGRRQGWGRNKRGVGFLLFLRPKFGYLLQNLPADVFHELLEGKIVDNKKTKFSHAKQIFFTFFRNNDEYEY